MYKPTTKLSTVLTEHPRAAAYLASINPQLKLLGNPVVIGLMAPRTDLRKVAERAGWTVEELEAAVVRSDTEGTATSDIGRSSGQSSRRISRPSSGNCTQAKTLSRARRSSKS